MAHSGHYYAFVEWMLSAGSEVAGILGVGPGDREEAAAEPQLAPTWQGWGAGRLRGEEEAAAGGLLVLFGTEDEWPW